MAQAQESGILVMQFDTITQAAILLGAHGKICIILRSATLTDLSDVLSRLPLSKREHTVPRDFQRTVVVASISVAASSMERADR